MCQFSRLNRVFLLIAVLPFVAPSPLRAASLPVKKVALNKELRPPARYGLERLEAALKQAGQPFIERVADEDVPGENADQPSRVFLLGTYEDSDQIKQWVDSGKVKLAKVAESLTVKRMHENGREQLVVAGYDSKGLMYALLDMADRLEHSPKTSDWFADVPEVAESPKNTMRRMRILRHHENCEKTWYASRAFWDWYTGMLATDRFNGLNIVHSHQTPYLAPMYAWYVHVDEYPNVKARGVSEEQRKQNLELLRYISDTCHERGIELTIGIWQHYPWVRSFVKTRPDQESYIEGLPPEDIGPYTYLALKEMFKECPGIRRIQIRCNEESGIPRSQQAHFYGNYVMKAAKEANPPVSIDIRLPKQATLAEAAKRGIDYRSSSKYFGEFMGLPYTPQDVVTSFYSYASKFSKPYRYPVFNETWMLGSHRVLLWGSEDYGRRFGQYADFGGIAIGFETDGPLAQKGYQEPYTPAWRIFAHPQDEYYTHEIERYWAFFRAIGRFGYNPQADREVWMRPFHTRFGDAAEAMAQAYESASQVVGLIAAYHTSDANMRVWPEVNMGGISPAYLDLNGIDKGLFPSVNEFVRDELDGKVTGRPGPLGLANVFERIADDCQDALQRAEGTTTNRSKEYEATVRDFTILLNLARFHAARQREGYYMARFNFTNDGYSLDQAEAWARRSIASWMKIVEVGNRSYTHDMLFGPTERGHWSDRVGILRANLDMILEAKRTLHKYGVFDVGFDFGSAAQARRYQNYTSYHYLNHQYDMPRFVSQSPTSLYHPNLGYGFVEPRELEAHSPPPLHQYKLNGQEPPPRDKLTTNLLTCDYVTSRHPIRFRMDLPMDEYQWTYLFADKSDAPVAHGPLNVVEVRRYGNATPAKDVTVSAGAEVHRIATYNVRADWYPCYEFIIEPAAEDANAMISAVTVHRNVANIAHAPVTRFDPSEPITLAATITMPPREQSDNRDLPISASSAGRLIRAEVRYRTLPAGEFQARELTTQDGFVYTATIPAGELSGSQLEYSFHVTDENGRQNRLPSPDAKNLFRACLSHDDTPPKIAHAPINEWKLGKPLSIEATATDESGVNELRLYYRVFNQARPYECVTMQRQGDRYVASIPAEAFSKTRDFVYYLEGIDEVGNGCYFPDWQTDQPYVIVRISE